MYFDMRMVDQFLHSRGLKTLRVFSTSPVPFSKRKS
jgi:hypothetical protein